jgi:hypothetical protein
LNEKGAEVTDQNDRNYNNNESQSIIFYFIADGASFEVFNRLPENRQPTVNGGNDPVNRVDRDGDGGYDQ